MRHLCVNARQDETLSVQELECKHEGGGDSCTAAGARVAPTSKGGVCPSAVSKLGTAVEYVRTSQDP